MRGVIIGKEKGKLSLFMDGMIVFLKKQSKTTEHRKSKKVQ